MSHNETLALHVAVDILLSMQSSTMVIALHCNEYLTGKYLRLTILKDPYYLTNHTCNL